MASPLPTSRPTPGGLCETTGPSVSPGLCCGGRSECLQVSVTGEGARSGGVEPTAQGGRMKLTGRASCLLTHRWIFASGHYSGSWTQVQQEASHQQQSCCPADLFQSLPDMVNPCQARGFLSSEAEALSWDIRNSWAWLAAAACV